MANRFYEVHSLVEEILMVCPEARNDDALLYMLVIKRINPRCARLPFEETFLKREEMGLPLYDTVTRSRRKCMEVNPTLRPSKRTLDARYEIWKEAREYAITQI